MVKPNGTFVVTTEFDGQRYAQTHARNLQVTYLTLKVGQKGIRLCEQDDSGWISVRVRGKTGVFPLKHVKEVPSLPSRKSVGDASSQQKCKTTEALHLRLNALEQELCGYRKAEVVQKQMTENNTNHLQCVKRELQSKVGRIEDLEEQISVMRGDLQLKGGLLEDLQARLSAVEEKQASQEHTILESKHAYCSEKELFDKLEAYVMANHERIKEAEEFIRDLMKIVEDARNFAQKLACEAHDGTSESDEIQGEKLQCDAAQADLDTFTTVDGLSDTRDALFESIADDGIEAVSADKKRERLSPDMGDAKYEASAFSIDAISERPSVSIAACTPLDCLTKQLSLTNDEAKVPTFGFAKRARDCKFTRNLFSKTHPEITDPESASTKASASNAPVTPDLATRLGERIEQARTGKFEMISPFPVKNRLSSGKLVLESDLGREPVRALFQASLSGPLECTQPEDGDKWVEERRCELNNRGQKRGRSSLPAMKVGVMQPSAKRVAVPERTGVEIRNEHDISSGTSVSLIPSPIHPDGPSRTDRADHLKRLATDACRGIRRAV